MRKLLAAVVASVLVSASLLSGQQIVFTPNGILPVLESYLESLRIQAAIPGMSAAVVKDGVIVWEKGYGFQNVPGRVRATPDTPYMIGDASAMVAATLLLQCVEHRRLDLDRPLGSFGIDIPEKNATLRQLLSHTRLDAEQPFVYDPGRFGQLGAVMEWCAPQPYRKSVSHRILNRLPMRDSVPGTDFLNPELELPTGMFDPVELERYRATLERIATPYKLDSRGRAERVDVPLESMTATGGLVSTVRDLAKFDSWLDDRTLLLDETLAQAWNPVMTSRGTAAPTGLGWFVQTHRGQRIVWQFGHVPNAYSSLIIKLPDHKLTFILLANSDRLSSPFELHQGDVSKSLFASLFLKLVT